MVGIRPLALIFLMLGLALPATAAGATTRIIVKRDPGLSTAEQRDIRQDAGVRLIDTLNLPHTEVVGATPSKADDALQELNADNDVAYAELDRRRAANGDPYFQWLWALENTGQQFSADEVAGTPDADIDGVDVELSPGVFATGAGITIAVVDSGIDDEHEDLAGQIADKVNFVGDDPDPDATDDGTGHGTAVSGEIAAIRDNGKGATGAAPDAQIMALRAIDDNGEARDSDIAEAFTYAGENGVRIVNASLGGPGASHTLDAAIAAYPNTLFVVSAGNGGDDHVGDDNDTAQVWPCNSPEPNVVCVGASENHDRRTGFSNYGDHTVDLFAPGYKILSPVPLGVTDFPTQRYLLFSGTSQAAPLVSAVAAMVLQANPEATADELKEIMLATADPKQAFVGYAVTAARLNANEAVKYAQGGPPPDGDGDGVANAADVCPAVPGTSHGCPLDRDSDGKPDAIDNCDLNANPTQADADRDGLGDACDTTPRGPDVDRDGKPALDDRCPTVYGTGPTGCPVITTTPSSGDRDRDGRPDVADGCPNEPARTLDGCPLPAVTALSAKLRKHRASITVRTSRAATVRITVQRKRGKRWVRVTSKRLLTSPSNRVRLRTKRLRAARYRVVVVLSSSAGRTSAQVKRFRVR